LIEMNAEPDDQPQHHERDERNADLEDTPCRIWVAIARNDFHPIARLARCGGRADSFLFTIQTRLRLVLSRW
jgi:hypothetical protein